MQQLDAPPIAPIYAQDRPNVPISLGTHRIEFSLDNTSLQRNAGVELRFLPNLGLRFVIPDDDTSLRPGGIATKLFLQDQVKISLPDYGQCFDGFCIAVGHEHGGTVLIPSVSVVTPTAPSDALCTADFHLFNFPAFIGPEDYLLPAGERCGQVILEADGWKTTIAATDRTGTLVKALSQEGGYVITHMGKIEHVDGSTFSSQQLQGLLQCLHYFLSFALGRWAGVALPVGLNQDGDRVFEQWGTPRIATDHWNPSLSWFDEHHAELLSQVFPGFSARWNEEIWAKPLKSALYWYLAANERGTGIGVDAGMILAQTALECLAWTYCIEHRKMVSKRAFSPKGLSASDKLRMLASALEIPTEIPGSMKALDARRGKKWVDIPEATTSIRNAIVHPSRNESFTVDSYFESWTLSMWLLDVVFLHLFNHTGSYGNRLAREWAGELDPVPWMKKTPVQTTEE